MPFRRHRANWKIRSRRVKGFCPIRVQGLLHEETIRQSLDLTNYEAANMRVRDWEVHGRKNSIFVLVACDRFFEQGEANGLSVDTINRQRLLKREF